MTAVLAWVLLGSAWVGPAWVGPAWVLPAVWVAPLPQAQELMNE